MNPPVGPSSWGAMALIVAMSVLSYVASTPAVTVSGIAGAVLVAVVWIAGRSREARALIDAWAALPDAEPEPEPEGEV